MIDLSDPDAYVDGPPHELFAELRVTDPVHWQDMRGEPGYWAVLRHADLVHVAREPTLFSAERGGVVIEDLDPERLAMMRNMLLSMDPPRHLDYRRPLVPSFKAKIIGGLEGRIRTICKEIMAGAAEQRDVEFVHDVTASLPSQVIGELVGLPRDDWAKIHRWAEMNTSGQDRDFQDADLHPEPASGDAGDVSGDSYAASGGDGTVHMAMYAIELAARRRLEPPREDLTSLILGTEFGGEFMSDIDFASFFVQMVTAGNDTTKTMLSSGLLALLGHPDQLAELRADPSLMPGAVEEILRWANPLHYFRRTASADTVLNGTRIAEGDKVAMMYTSANRDEEVFANPNGFDIHRHPNPHVSFGIGEHFCLGVHLARLEARVFFEELLATFATIELRDEPKRTRSNLNNALKSLPVTLVAA
ncbi:MAG TPA: cytochrome P450 [Acidimicrobiia bacterium]